MNETEARPWQVDASAFPEDAPRSEQYAFLLRYAHLAPSSHNTQPWHFEIEGDGISVLLDRERWLRVADADQRELYISVGCALENLLVAAEHFGFAGTVRYLPQGAEGDVAAEVQLQPSANISLHRPQTLFPAITQRHTNHRPYDGRPLTEEQVQRLQETAVESGIEIHLTADPSVRRTVDELVSRADALQFADPAWRQELGHWLGKGVFGSGWIMSKASQLAVTYLNMGQGTAKKDSELLDSASALGVITARPVDRTVQLQVGQVFERMFLTATAMEMALQPMNQILQVTETRAEFEALLPAAWGVPQLTFRLGYAPPEGHTPRRELSDVLH